jgi:Tfp pilus assembly protein PilN
MADRLPKKVAITELVLSRDRLLISALTEIIQQEREFDNVKLYMDRLRATPLFFEDISTMKFKESSRFTKDEQELLDFAISCEVRASETTRSRIRTARSVSKSGKPQIGG